MIELSLGKMVLLALIALIVLGPEKLPGAARTAGALLRRVRSGWDNVKAEVERELEIEEIRRSAREAVASAEAAQQHVKDTLKEAHDPFAEAAAMVKLQPSPSSNTAEELPEDMTPEERASKRQLSALQSGSVTSESHSAESPASEIGPRETHFADSPVADDQALEGLQSELPMDGPPIKFRYDKDASHGNA
jgi:sec-independent protein translocase protein TatB